MKDKNTSEWTKAENKRLRKKIEELENYIRGLKDAIYLASPKK